MQSYSDINSTIRFGTCCHGEVWTMIIGLTYTKTRCQLSAEAGLSGKIWQGGGCGSAVVANRIALEALINRYPTAIKITQCYEKD